ncbi:MAG: hypothetical protein WDZ51_04320 [Pirellulaceae bacterium]
MIAQSDLLDGPSLTPSPSPCWQAEFLGMLPRIEKYARFHFRGLRGDTLDEAVQEVVCHSCQAYSQLVAQGRAHVATWSSLAKFALKRYRDGRRVGGSLNVNDICSVHCRRRKGVQVQPLRQWDDQGQEWTEILVEDKKSTPAEIAATRIDFPAFLATLSPRDRHITERLATGESTGLVSERFGISPGRISQLRKELKVAWERFHQLPSEVERLAAAGV